MVQFDLDRDEAEILARTLETDLADLRYEISNTDRQDYRLELKVKKAVLQKVVDAITTTRQMV